MKIFIHRNGINYGPYSESSVRSFLEEGTLSPMDLAWTPGRTEWTKLESLLGETGVQSSNPGLSDEDKENVDKIKGLLEKEEVEFALDLIRGLDSEEVIYALLEDWRIDEEDGSPIAPEWGGSADGFFLDLLNELPSERAEQLDSSIVPSKVRKLSLRWIEGMKNIDRVKVFPNLETLELDSMDELSDLEALSEFPELTSLKIENCSGLEELESLDPVFRCPTLTRLDLSGLLFGKSADCLSALTKLTDLSLERCTSLENLDGLEALTNLRHLGLRGCSSVVSIDALEEMSTLTRLDLEGTDVPMDECKKLEESGGFDYLSLPNGSTIEKFPESEDSGGALPRIEFYLGGYGLEAHEGSISEAMYAYWKDRSESELIEHCEWDDYENEEDDDIPEDARLGAWNECDDISACYGCQDGTLDVTEFRKLEDGWLKKYQPIRIEGGDSEDGDVKVHWVKCGRVAPTGPYFRGFSSEKGMYFNQVLEGKTFDPSKLELFSEPVFGGAQGYAINRIDYDGEELEFCPETDNKGYYFEIMPPPEEELNIVPDPEKEEEDSSEEEENEEDSSDEEQDIDEIIEELDEEEENGEVEEEFDFMDEMDEKPKDLPSGFVYLWSKAKTFLKIGPEAYRKRDYFGLPDEEWDEAIIRKGMEQVAEFRGYSADKPFEDLGISGFRMLLQTLHFELDGQSAQQTEGDVFLDEMHMKHVVDGRIITLYNKVSYEEDPEQE